MLIPFFWPHGPLSLLPAVIRWSSQRCTLQKCTATLAPAWRALGCERVLGGGGVALLWDLLPDSTLPRSEPERSHVLGPITKFLPVSVSSGKLLSR